MKQNPSVVISSYQVPDRYKALYVPEVIQSSQPPRGTGIMTVSILQMNGLRLEAEVASSPPGRGKSGQGRVGSTGTPLSQGCLSPPTSVSFSE